MKTLEPSSLAPILVALVFVPVWGAQPRHIAAPQASLVASAATAGYQKPRKAILDVLSAPLPPNVFVSPAHDCVILATPVRYPPISYLAEPMLRLAGTRIVPKNRSLHGATYWSELNIVKTSDGTTIRVKLPPGARALPPYFSADGKRYVFALITADAVELWVGQPTSADVHRIDGVRLQLAMDDEMIWLADQKSLVVKLVPATQGEPPPTPVAPRGPNVQETSGGAGASSTYEVRDVLKSAHDEELFEHYAASQLAIVNVESGKITPVGKPGILAQVQPAPDGEHLLVETVHRPYSYLTTHERFPREVEIWNRRGQVVHRLASLPLADRVPIWGVPLGPRGYVWRATDPATLVWLEALDGGDWNRKVPHRDKVMMHRAPFANKPVEVTRTEQRAVALWWSEQPDLALVVEDDAIRHWVRTFALNLDNRAVPPRLIWSHSTDEQYQYPGDPIFRLLPNGVRVLMQDGDNIYLRSLGASPEGDRPFLDRFNLKTLAATRLFRCQKDAFERVVDLFDGKGTTFLTLRESPSLPPNLFARKLESPAADAPAGEAAWVSSSRPITHLPDSAPAVRGITKRLVKYKRPDGVELSFTLYLPPGYKKGTRLPAVLWAYPLDYADPRMAGQISGSDQRFTVLGWPLQHFFALDGYAVIDDAALPIVGDTNKIYDTYLEQLVLGAKAAVDKAVELGVVDPERIGVTGHSHGALMTANLLAHSDLFRAGIARSGSYNKSLTAFGFQSERRTLWAAPGVYVEVSPYFAADRIDEPLLLIHGEIDVNPGTTPPQSEKFFEAIRGTGGTARLVMLPFESHGYRARESTEHALYEMLAWFDRHVKRALPREKKKGKQARG